MQSTTVTREMLDNPEISVADLSAMFGRPEAWVAGLLDAMTGDQDWAYSFHADDVSPTQAEQADYRDGYRNGPDLVAAPAAGVSPADGPALAA